MQIGVASSSAYMTVGQHTPQDPEIGRITHRGNENKGVISTELAKLRCDDDLGRDEQDRHEVQRDADAKNDRGEYRGRGLASGSGGIEF